MPHTCQTCGRSWDDSLAEENDYRCTRKCNGILAPNTENTTSSLEPISWPLAIEETYPFPIACALRRLREDFESHTEERDALRQLIRIKDLVETTVKFLALVSLAARLDRKDAVDELDRRILQSLVSPSLGTWVQGILQPLVKSPGMRSDPRMTPLVELADKSLFAELQDFTAFRNRILGHGVVRHPREDRADLLNWLPRILQILERAAFLGEPWLLIQALPSTGEESWRSWSGAKAENDLIPLSLDEDPSPTIRPGEFFLAGTDGSPVSLYPFIYLLICPRCEGTERLFIYDGQSRYTTSRKEVALLENHGGHKEVFTSIGEALSEQFSETLLLDYYRKHRRNFEVLEGKLVEFDFDSYREKIRHFVGRKPVFERIQTFLSGDSVPVEKGLEQAFDRGYFLLVAEAGVGKTALLTHWIDNNDSCPLPIRFYWRRGRNLTPFDFVRHLYHGLLAKHNMEDSEPPEDENDYRRKLDSLLTTVSERYLSEGEREVIVIDGLDEAGDQKERIEAIRAIPRSLPRNVYFLLSSRPIREMDSLPGDSCYTWKLDSEAEWNRSDIREYIEHQLAEQLESGELKHDQLPLIDHAAEGNFLWAEYFCQGVLTETLSLKDLHEGLPRLAGLDGMYREFWNRVTESLNPETEQRVWRVAGVLLVSKSALTAEQICRFASLGDDEFVVVRRILQQYLDEIELANDLDPESPLIGFRIYHASFRDYLARQPDMVLRHHHNRIVDFYLQNRSDGYESWDRYGLSFLCSHLSDSDNWDHLIGNTDSPGVLCDVAFIEAKCAAGLGDQLSLDYAKAKSTLPELLTQHEREKVQMKQCLEYRASLSHCQPVPPPAAVLPNFVRQKSHATPTSQGSFGQMLESFSSLVIRHRQSFCRVAECVAPFCYNHAEGAIADISLAWLEKSSRPWLKRKPRPPAPSYPALCDSVLNGHPGKISSAVVNADFSLLISGSDLDGTLRVWNLETGVCRSILEGHMAGIWSMDANSEFTKAITGSDDSTIRIWDLLNEETIGILQDGREKIRALAADSNFSTAISGGSDKIVKIWDLEKGSCRKRLTGHEEGIRAVILDAGGTRAISGGWDCNLRLWNIENESTLRVYEGHTDGISAISVNRYFSLALTASDDQTLRLWDLKSGSCLRILQGHDVGVTSVATSADFKFALSAGWDGTQKIWNIETGECLASFREHAGRIRSVGVSADFRKGFSASDDRTIRTWNFGRGEPTPCLPGHDGWVNSVEINKGRVISGGSDGMVKLSRWESAHTQENVASHNSPIRTVNCSSDGAEILTGSNDGILRVWELTSGKCRKTLNGHDAKIWKTVADKDFTKALSGSADRTIVLWDLQSYTKIHTLEGHSHEVRALEVSRGFDLAISGSWDNTLRIWDLNDGNCKDILRGHCAGVRTVAVDAGFTKAISGGWDQTLRTWDLESGLCTGVLSGHLEGITEVSVNPDFTMAVSASWDKYLRVWDLQSSECLLTHYLGAEVLSLSADFETFRLACGCADGQVHHLSWVNNFIRD